MAGGVSVRLDDDWKDVGFAQVPNNILRDPALSWKAKGIISYLASHREDRKMTRSFLLGGASDGETSFRSGMKELREAGYVTVENDRDDVGGFTDTRYMLHRYPRSARECGKPAIPGTRSADSDVQKETKFKGAYGEGDMVKPSSGPPAPATDALFDLPGQDTPAEDEPVGLPPDAPTFDDFWAAYPPDRRVEKKYARKAWDKALFAVKLAERGVLAHTIVDGAKRYAKERVGQPTKFTKHPRTWLNGGCWDDAPEANANAGGYTPYRDEDYHPGAEPWFKPGDWKD